MCVPACTGQGGVCVSQHALGRGGVCPGVSGLGDVCPGRGCLPGGVYGTGKHFVIFLGLSISWQRTGIHDFTYDTDDKRYF